MRSSRGLSMLMCKSLSASTRQIDLLWIMLSTRRGWTGNISNRKSGNGSAQMPRSVKAGTLHLRWKQSRAQLITWIGTVTPQLDFDRRWQPWRVSKPAPPIMACELLTLFFERGYGEWRIQCVCRSYVSRRCAIELELTNERTRRLSYKGNLCSYDHAAFLRLHWSPRLGLQNNAPLQTTLLLPNILIKVPMADMTQIKQDAPEQGRTCPRCHNGKLLFTSPDSVTLQSLVISFHQAKRARHRCKPHLPVKKRCLQKCLAALGVVRLSCIIYHSSATWIIVVQLLIER